MMRLDYSFILDSKHWGKGCFAEDYLMLAAIVNLLKPRVVLEIGTNTGLGAVLLASCGATVTTIDIDQSAGKRNLGLVPEAEKRINFIENTSDKALPWLTKRGRKYDLIFIDGAHDYEQAARDWYNTQPLTSTWVLHDTTQYTGLQRLVAEIRLKGEYETFQFVAAPGHRKKPSLTQEKFITGMTLVQRRDNLKILAGQAHRGDDGKLLPGHDELSVPKLKGLYDT